MMPITVLLVELETQYRSLKSFSAVVIMTDVTELGL
jgi:hypothetical protein